MESAGSSKEVAVESLVKLYDRAPADGVLNFAEWTHLVLDLLCLRDGVLHVDQSVASAAAAAIAQHGFGPLMTGQTPHVTVLQVAQLSDRWEETLLRNGKIRSALGGSPRLRFLHDPELPAALQNLQRHRGKESRKRDRKEERHQRKERRAEESAASSAAASAAAPVFRTLFFPDAALPCRSFLRGECCRRWGCAFAHAPTNLSRMIEVLRASQRCLDVCVFNITCKCVASP